MRNPEVQVWVGRARVAALAGQAEPLPGCNTYAWLDPIADLREVRAVVAHAIVADDRHCQPAAGRTVVDLRIPAILAAHKVYHAVGHGDEFTPDRAEDIGRRIIVM